MKFLASVPNPNLRKKYELIRLQLIRFQLKTPIREGELCSF